jgi:hypothetical protein
MTITDSEIPDDWDLVQDPRNHDEEEFQMTLSRAGESSSYALVDVRRREKEWGVMAQHESAGAAPMGGLPVATYRAFEDAEEAHNFAVEVVNNLHKWPEFPEWKSD